MADGRIKRSQAQERRTARKFAGQRQPASGAFDTAKNDVRTPRDLPESEQYLIENKRTDNTSSITLKVSDIKELGRNAGLIGRQPLMHVEIAGLHLVVCEDWVWDNRGAKT